jgi:hypothetical protein
VKECPVPQCGTLIRAQVTFCNPHWRALPVELRDVLSTFPPGTFDYEAAMREALAFLADRAELIVAWRRTG